MEYVIVKRLKDNQEIVIPKKDLHDTLKQGFELVGDYSVFKATPKEDVVIRCPLCDFVAKSVVGLKVHKKKHEKDSV